MPKFMVAGNYSADGIKGVLKDGGSGRKQAVEAAVEAMGGKVESVYYAFGDVDVYVVIDVPDNVTALALSMGIASTGLVGVKTTVLMTVDEVDRATKKTVSYRPPGR